MFPTDGGTTIPAPTVASLPGELYSLPSGACSGLDPSILYRVNAAGPALPSQDCGPDWSDDTASSSPYRNSGSSVTTWSGLPTIDATVPATTPPAIFGSERWDGSTSPEMQWDFPVPAGRHVRVRLYFADRCSCTASAGSRVFDVVIDGMTMLDNWDANAAVGHNVGTMRAFDITSDGSVTVTFAHGVNNPEINGIELIDLDATPITPGAQQWIAHRGFDGATAGARVQQNSTIDWSRARGAFYANGRLYYGWDDGKLYRRSFSGGSFGAAKVVATNGLVPGYFPVANLTGMFLQDGRLYYTVRGDDRLYYRYFTVESGAVGAVTFIASAPGSGFDWGSVRGLTLAGGNLYLARADGSLWSAGWTPGLEHGSPVNGSLAPIDADPAQQWAARGMFVRNP
jgi:hypothetical protein